MKKLFQLLLFFSMLIFIFFLPLVSVPVKMGVTSGIDICLNELIPSLFPFLFFSSLIYFYGGGFLSSISAPLLCPLFKISKNACPAVISGILGGFPSGAAIAAELYKDGKISKSEAERLPVFCNNAGLMFTVGTLGTGHFDSFKTGVIIYLFHIFSSFVAGVLTSSSAKQTCSFKKNDKIQPILSPLPEAFTKAVFRAISSMALISGNFIIFKVISSVFSVFFKDSMLKSFIFGLLEVTGGALSMPKSNTGIILSLFLLSFNGICVHTQTLSYFSPLKLSVKKYIKWKLFCAFLSSFLMKIALPTESFSTIEFPSMVFYVIVVLLPLLFLVPKKQKSRMW